MSGKNLKYSVSYCDNDWSRWIVFSDYYGKENGIPSWLFCIAIVNSSLLPIQTPEDAKRTDFTLDFNFHLPNSLVALAYDRVVGRRDLAVSGVFGGDSGSVSEISDITSGDTRSTISAVLLRFWGEYWSTDAGVPRSVVSNVLIVVLLIGGKSLLLIGPWKGGFFKVWRGLALLVKDLIGCVKTESSEKTLPSPGTS